MRMGNDSEELVEPLQLEFPQTPSTVLYLCVWTGLVGLASWTILTLLLVEKLRDCFGVS